MSQENKVQLEEHLNKYNFEEWEFLINNILKSKKILKYIESDLINNLKNNLTGLNELPNKTEEDLNAIDIDLINHTDTKDKDISYISKFKNNSKQKSNYKNKNTTKASRTKLNKNNKIHDFNNKYKTGESSEKEIPFEELKTMYYSNIDNIETIIDYPNNENKTTWTFDTGASEHITNNKDILKNFKEEKVIGIKLAKNGMKCNLKARKKEVYFTLKTKNDKNCKIIQQPQRLHKFFETIYSDVIGPIQKSITGKRYITFIDEFSRKS
ncbi:hypothetical protein PIROE2DRAFT_1233 [Piromyces sp. E2]|nr:hypothetical protein PIROE2DRAFT_1233 [Piromyces sp. E2]|eukprot:OUM70683.1 hypothetical protein PIROE2DRAFT_1233 [Piromyces sp. E2]